MSEVVKHISCVFPNWSCVLCCSAVCHLWCQQCLLLQTVSKLKSIESQEIKWIIQKKNSENLSLWNCLSDRKESCRTFKLLLIHSSKKQSNSWSCTFRQIILNGPSVCLTLQLTADWSLSLPGCRYTLCFYYNLLPTKCFMSLFLLKGNCFSLVLWRDKGASQKYQPNNLHFWLISINQTISEREFSWTCCYHSNPGCIFTWCRDVNK